MHFAIWVPRHFDDSYSEIASLRDGTRVRLRLLRPADRDRLLDGFLRLSDQSRYQRFLVPKARLTERELDYLVDVDQESHFAICAIREEPGEEDVGLGVGRFIRLAESPGVAEAAVTVVDDVQGQGLGALLLTRLVWAARERGVHRFRCEVLAQNRQMRDLLFNLTPRAEIRSEGAGVVTVEYDVDEAALYDMIRLAAREFDRRGGSPDDVRPPGGAPPRARS